MGLTDLGTGDVIVDLPPQTEFGAVWAARKRLTGRRVFLRVAGTTTEVEVEGAERVVRPTGERLTGVDVRGRLIVGRGEGRLTVFPDILRWSLQTDGGPRSDPYDVDVVGSCEIFEDVELKQVCEAADRNENVKVRPHLGDCPSAEAGAPDAWSSVLDVARFGDLPWTLSVQEDLPMVHVLAIADALPGVPRLTRTNWEGHGDCRGEAMDADDIAHLGALYAGAAVRRARIYRAKPQLKVEVIQGNEAAEIYAQGLLPCLTDQPPVDLSLTVETNRVREVNAPEAVADCVGRAVQSWVFFGVEDHVLRLRLTWIPPKDP